MKRLIALAAVLASTPVSAAPGDLTVGLYRYAPPTRLIVRGPGGVAIAEGRQGFRPIPAGALTVRAEGARVYATAGGRRLAAGPVLFLRGEGPWSLEPEGGTARRYAGRLAFRAQKGRLLPVLSLPLETYLESTVADEMPPNWPATALEAQAIAARSYATAERNRHRAEGFDFCDLTHCQLFRGLAARDGRVDAAVRDTAGQVLRYQGRVATTTWHSTCGGERAPNTVVFGGVARPYLSGGPDRAERGKPWCTDSPHFAPWRVTYRREALEAALRKAGVLQPQEPLKDLNVTDRLRSGFAAAVTVTGNHPRAMTGYQLWMALGPHFGWGEIKGPAFTIVRTTTGYAFTGVGLGHGVGMCQWGARGQALAGHPPTEILQFYFPGTVIRR